MSMVISSGLEIKDPSVVVKYRWLNEKFSPHLAMIKRAAPTDGPRRDVPGKTAMGSRRKARTIRHA
jgi:hypothetical protein